MKPGKRNVPTGPRAPRRAGRPARAGRGDVKRDLARAGRELFARHGYDAVPLRQVADAAGVNPAMIHYYFGDKAGFHEAVLEDTLAPLFASLDGPVPGVAPETAIRAFVEAYIRTLASNPWIPALLMREVFAEDGRFRKRFIKQFASRGGGLLQALIRRSQQEGRLRGDLDPSLAALSLISLMLFPFISFPVAREVFGLKMNQAFVQQLVDHTERLFLEGVRQ